MEIYEIDCNSKPGRANRPILIVERGDEDEDSQYANKL